MRRFLIGFAILAIGIGIGVNFERWYVSLTPAPAPPAPPPVASVSAPASSPAPAASTALGGQIFVSFEGNIYPSLLLSLGAADPELTRCLSLEVTHAPVGQVCRLTIASELFTQPVVLTATAAAESFPLKPDLPWNYAAL